jgi:aryl-alcohol dehydrogenase-like predicted oxidoreductase
MQQTILGQSGLEVPVFCVGTAPLGQLPREEAVQVLHRAYELGATWWDTADSYGTEPLVGEALARVERRLITISTKTSVPEYYDAKSAVVQARGRLGLAAIDIMFLHNVRDREDFTARRGCLHALRDLRANGSVRAIGLSSHNAEPIRLAAGEPDIDVVMAPWNSFGQMPDDIGSMREMEAAIRACYAAGKGVVLMKILDAGHLRPDFDDAIKAAAGFKEKHTLNIGVQSTLELETDIRLVLGEPVDASILRFLKTGSSDGRKAA